MKENNTLQKVNHIPPINKRVLCLLESKGVSGYRLEKDNTGIKQTQISHLKSGRNKASEDLINSLLEYFTDVNRVWLLTGEGEMFKDNTAGRDIITGGNVVAGNTGSINIVPQGELKPKQYSHTLEVRLVTNKAKAGWSDGYYNEEYLEDMPIVVIDADDNYKGKYLAFEVAGDSMEPDYLEGDIVICREVQRHLWNSKLHFKDWDFVIAHFTQGIMLKEVIDHNVETGDIVCRSINPKHKDFTLNLREIAHLYNVVEVRQKGRKKRWNRAKDFFEN